MGIRPSVRPSVCPSVRPSVRLSVRPSGSVRVRPGPSGSVRVRPGPSGSVRVRPGSSGFVRPVRVRPGPSGSVRPSVCPGPSALFLRPHSEVAVMYWWGYETRVWTTAWARPTLTSRRSIDPDFPSEQLALKHAVHGATSTLCHSALSNRSEPGEKAVSYQLPFDRTWVIAN